MISVREIPTIDTYAIRHSVLREGMPIESCYWDTDENEGTFHLGGFINGTQTGVSTFQKEMFPDTGENAYRLRGMAVLPESRSEGIGSLMLLAGEDRVRNMGFKLIWCHARIGAVAFYQRNGWKTIGDVFDIPTAGPHYLMTKDLSQPVGCKAP